MPCHRSAFLLSASIFTPILGRLGDMFGTERMLVVALVTLALGSLVAALVAISQGSTWGWGACLLAAFAGVAVPRPVPAPVPVPA